MENEISFLRDKDFNENISNFLVRSGLMYIGGDFLCISDLYNEEDNIVIYNCVKRIFSDLEIRRSLKLM